MRELHDKAWAAAFASDEPGHLNQSLRSTGAAVNETSSRDLLVAQVRALRHARLGDT